MMGRNIHAISQVKTMGAESLHARVEVDLLAALRSCETKNPVEEALSMPTRATLLISDEILNVEVSSPGKGFSEAETRDGSYRAVILQQS